MSNFTLVWHFLIFGVLPYVVIAVLVVGSLLRFILAPYSWKSQSSEILDKKDLFWGANLFHIGVIFLFCGHCFGLFTPTAWLNAVGLTPRLHQWMEIIAGGASAALAIAGLFTFDYEAWQKILLVPDWQKWHIFVGLIIFLIVPFTRLVHIWSGYLSVFYLVRPHQIMRANGKPMK